MVGSPSRSKVPFSPWPRRARTDAGSDHFFFEFRNKPFRDGQWAPWAGRRKSLRAFKRFFISFKIVIFRNSLYLGGFSCQSAILVHTYMKAVGNKGELRRKISSRTFCAAVHKDHLSSHLAKTRSPNAARSPLISLLCPRAAGGRIVIPSVPQLKVFDTSDSPCWQSAAVTSSSSCRNPFAVR